jgi:hypothetical protein
MRNDQQIDVTSESQYFDKNLASGTYIYRIIAVNEHGQTASNDIEIVVTIQATVPNAVTNLSADKDFQSVELSWEPSQNTIHYNVQGAGQSINILQTSVTIDSLQVDSLYTFQVFAINENGSSEPAEISVRTKGKYIATWSPNKEDDLAGYNVFNAKTEQLVRTTQDTSFTFIVGQDGFDIEAPSIKLKAFDKSGNESEFSETAHGE